MRDELDELSDKLESQASARRVGFVTNLEPTLDASISKKIGSMEDSLDVAVKIMHFSEWIVLFLQDYPTLSEEEFCYNWISSIVNSLGQNKRDLAPIDEPCEQWMSELCGFLNDL